MTLCDYAITAKDNKLSIMGLFDRIFVHRLPIRYSRFFLVVLLHAVGVGKHKLQLKCLSPSNQVVLPAKEIDVTFTANGKANIVTDITHLNLTEFGEYLFVVERNGQSLGTTKLFVSRLQQHTTDNQQLN